MALEHVSRLARAVEENWCGAWSSLGRVADQLTTLVDDSGEFLRVCTPRAPEMLLNAVLRYAGASPVRAPDVERVIAPYRRYHLPFQWWMTVGEEPHGLREQLHRLQMQSCGSATAMALDLDAWDPPQPLSPLGEAVWARRVATAEERHAALQVICDVFYVPPGPMARWTTDNPAFKLYLSETAGQAVSALATLPLGQTVGVYHVATRPGYRRRGIAGALLTLALQEARAEGARLATLTATPEARMLYESLGFRTCGYIEQWIPGPELMARLTYGGPAAPPRGGWWS
jgi:GNAT superfamily N-acetyltransferase